MLELCPPWAGSTAKSEILCLLKGPGVKLHEQQSMLGVCGYAGDSKKTGNYSAERFQGVRNALSHQGDHSATPPSDLEPIGKKSGSCAAEVCVCGVG